MTAYPNMSRVEFGKAPTAGHRPTPVLSETKENQSQRGIGIAYSELHQHSKQRIKPHLSKLSDLLSDQVLGNYF